MLYMSCAVNLWMFLLSVLSSGLNTRHIGLESIPLVTLWVAPKPLTSFEATKDEKDCNVNKRRLVLVQSDLQNNLIHLLLKNVYNKYKI